MSRNKADLSILVSLIDSYATKELGSASFAFVPVPPEYVFHLKVFIHFCGNADPYRRRRLLENAYFYRLIIGQLRLIAGFGDDLDGVAIHLASPHRSIDKDGITCASNFSRIDEAVGVAAAIDYVLPDKVRRHGLLFAGDRVHIMGGCTPFHFHNV